MTEPQDMKCGFCVTEKPAQLFVGWKGWFICGNCCEGLIKTWAQTDRAFRERLIEELKVLEDWVPPPSDNVT